MILETEEHKELFLKYWNSESCIIFPIWCDLEKHPLNNELSFLYVRFRSDETDQGDYTMDWILPFNHNDCEKLQIDLSTSTHKKKVYNKKGLLQMNLNIQNMYDFQLEYFSDTNIVPTIETDIEVLTNFYNRLGLRDDLGKSIPIMKWIELLQGFTDQYVDSGEIFFTESWIDDKLIPTLSRVEKRGLNVVRKKFIDKWSSSFKQLKGSTVYTEYNPYTITSRPSNRHGGVNYGALNKNDGTREMFIPRDNKIFLQFDYDAYHVRLIAKMIDYKIPHKSGHQWLADMYGCSYSESKNRTFQIVYGGVSIIDRRIPFFAKVDDYIQNMYKETLRVGYVETPIGKRKIPLEYIENHNAQKVFNYLLQATETELNIEIIRKLYDAGIESLCLYSYDAFLFEYDKSSGVDEAKKIKEIIESFGFPVKASWGSDYSKL